jgi:tRNA A22 N-methylase
MGLRLAGTNQVILAINGEISYAGKLVSAAPGTKVDNATTATPFTITADNQAILIQPDVAVYIYIGAVAGMGTTGANAILLEANEKYVFVPKSDTVKVSVDPVVGACSVKVFTII